MQQTQAVAVMVALFALRCLLPLAVTLGIAYLMNRQVARWEAAAAREAHTAPAIAGVKRSAAPRQPCWEARQCDAARRDACPAYRQSGRPCWAVRLEAEGVLPSGCVTCPLYAPVLAI